MLIQGCLLNHPRCSGTGRIELVLVQAAPPGAGDGGVRRRPMRARQALPKAKNLWCMLSDQWGRHCCSPQQVEGGAAPCSCLCSSAPSVTDTVQSVISEFGECGTPGATPSRGAMLRALPYAAWTSLARSLLFDGGYSQSAYATAPGRGVNNNKYREETNYEYQYRIHDHHRNPHRTARGLGRVPRPASRPTRCRRRP